MYLIVTDTVSGDSSGTDMYVSMCFALSRRQVFEHRHIYLVAYVRDLSAFNVLNTRRVGENNEYLL